MGNSLDQLTTARYSLATIPLYKGRLIITGAPKIDKDMARLHELITVQGDISGVAAPYPTFVYIRYRTDRSETQQELDGALYVAFECTLPEGRAPRASGVEQDSFEVYLGTADTDGFQFRLQLRAGGTLRAEQVGVDGDWLSPGITIPGVLHSVSRTLGQWRGELEIPFTALQLAANPNPGDMWRANFVVRRETPEPAIEAWCYWDIDQEPLPRKNGYLCFGGQDSTYIVCGGSWDALWDVRWLSIRVRGNAVEPIPPNPNPPQRKFEVSARIRRRPYQSDRPATLYGELEDRLARGDYDQGEMLPNEYKGVEAWSSIDLLAPYYIKVLPDRDFSNGWLLRWLASDLACEDGYLPVEDDTSGDYVLHYHFDDTTEGRISVAGGIVPFHVAKAPRIQISPYILTRRSIVIRADVRAIPQRDRIKFFKVQIGDILDPNDIFWETTVRFEYVRHVFEKCRKREGQTFEVDYPWRDIEIPITHLPVGCRQRVRLTLLDASSEPLQDGEGTPYGVAEASFNLPNDPDWWIHRDAYGAEPRVPWPWTPIRSERRGGHYVVSVWGRQLEFRDSVLPSQIINQGQSMLAAPIELVLLGPARPSSTLPSGPVILPWARQRLTNVETRADRVTLNSYMAGGGIAVTAKSVLEFDGFSLIELEIQPDNENAQIEGLELIIPLKAEFAQYLTNYGKAPGPPILERDDSRLQRYIGPTPQRYTSLVMLTTWLGNDAMGLEWSAESSRGWILHQPHEAEAIVIERQGRNVQARFRFINGPTRITKPRRIRFGLVATPVKAVPPERRNWRIDHASNPPPIPRRTIKNGSLETAEELEEYWVDRNGIDVHVTLSQKSWSGQDSWHAYVTDPNLAQILCLQNRALARRGMRVLRNGGWTVSTLTAEWDPWGKEMLATPRNPTDPDKPANIHSYSSPHVEFLVGSWALNARHHGVHGIRFDTVVPWYESLNPYLDETWTAQDGNTYGTVNLFRQREMMKRLYRILHGGEIDDGLIYLPLAGPPIMAVESFVDIHEIGEGKFEKATTLKDGYVQEQMRVWMNSTPYGFVEVNSIKGNPLKPNQRIGALLAAGAAPRLMSREAVDFNDYSIAKDRMPTTAIWNSFSWIDKGTAEWHPHWKNNDGIRSTASPGGEHYVSFHLQPGRRILLVVVNYETFAQEITVELNAGLLGFEAGVVLEAQDAITGEPIVMQGQVTMLRCDPQLYRLIKIAIGDDLSGANMDGRPDRSRPDAYG